MARLESRLSFTRLEGHLIQVDLSRRFPRVRLNENAARLVGSALVLGIACYMGFSAGA
jgi:hypothetical protein